MSHPCCVPELGRGDWQDHSRRADALSQLSGTDEVGLELCPYLGITQQKPAPKNHDGENHFQTSHETGAAETALGHPLGETSN